MGWSDVALCLAGPVVQDLRTHFAQRWNFIYDEKYSKKATRYSRLPETSSGAQQGGAYPPPPMEQRGFEDEKEGQRGFGGEEETERGLFGHGGSAGGHFRQKIVSKIDQYGQEHGSHHGGYQQSHAEHSSQRGGVDCQIARSSAKWSHNLVTTEVSNALCVRDRTNSP
jgi:phospholipase D1/2